MLNLRNNGGGSTQGAIEIASYFIQSGIIKKNQYADRTETIHADKDVAKAPNVPLAIQQIGI